MMMEQTKKHVSLLLNREQQEFDTLKESLSSNGVMIYAGRLLQRAYRMRSETPVLIYEDAVITYKELYGRACAFARTLKKNGVVPGDRVLMCFENTPEFYVAYFAIWHCGAVVVPLNTFLKGIELQHIVDDSNPRLIVTALERQNLFTQQGVSGLPLMLTEHDMCAYADVSPDVYEDELIDQSPEVMAALLYTSGTTGLPKGVMLSSNNIMTNLLQSAVRLDVDEHERVFGILPLFHSFAQVACVWGSIFKGYTIILVHKIDRRLILNNLKHKPTIFLGVPALFGLLCLLKTAPLDSVKYFVSGGDALPDKIRMLFELIYRRRIVSGYGLTETTPLISVDLNQPEYVPTNNVGTPCVGIQVAIRDEQGTDLADGAIGEIVVKGGNVMMGYYNSPEQTEKVLKDGWFKTGDLGYLDEKGRILITGRIKDLIINKGFNIYPQEIENVLLSHQNVLRAGVVGQPDEAGGEVPIAFVQVRKLQPTIEKELREICKQHLAAYKIPRDFICSTDELPATATGKVDKKVLRKMLAGE